jgi:cation diffusion facilitator CzcD-associated flavoprotein CzcO
MTPPLDDATTLKPAPQRRRATAKATETLVLEVAIIGAGIAGLCMAIQLRKAGFTRFAIFEKGDGVGGTWRDNVYPGSGCDVPSHLYSFSFEPKSDWTKRYAEQPEILRYLEHCSEKYGLAPHLRLGTEVASARFDEAAGLWRLATARGELITARVLVSGTGQLNRPSWPDLPGLERFKGTSFHSARWPAGFDPTGKRVAVIGNGASAIQFIPRIAAKTAKLHLFQRSANWMVPKPDREYRPFEQSLFRHLPGYAWLYRLYLYLQLEKNFFAFIQDSWYGKQFRKVAEAALNRVADPALRESLRPDYPLGCKRILLSNDYYPALQLPQVEVVPAAIECLTDDGIVTADGIERPIDTIIVATGFESLTFLAPMAIEGLGGRKIDEMWRDGAEAYLGLTVAGFPNFFMLYGPNTNLGHNSIIVMIEAQVNYAMQCIGALFGQNLLYMDVKETAQRRFNEELQRDVGKSVWATSCKSWYKTATGKITNNWSGFTLKYRWATWKPDFGDYFMRQRD